MSRSCAPVRAKIVRLAKNSFSTSVSFFSPPPFRTTDGTRSPRGRTHNFADYVPMIYAEIKQIFSLTAREIRRCRFFVDFLLSAEFLIFRVLIN